MRQICRFARGYLRFHRNKRHLNWKHIFNRREIICVLRVVVFATPLVNPKILDVCAATPSTSQKRWLDPQPNLILHDRLMPEHQVREHSPGLRSNGQAQECP